MLELLAHPDARVIALGGGALGSSRVRDALRGHTVVHLEVDPEDAWRARLGPRPAARARTQSLRGSSTPTAWRSTTLRRTRSCRRASAGCRRVLPGARGARGGAGRHAARVGLGRVGRVPRLPRAGPRRRRLLPSARGRRFVVTDAERRAPPSRRGRRADRRSRPASGTRPSRARRRCCAALARAGAERGDLAVAVGGGVVGDLAGFCAAVYQRGMRHVQVPTTLVAQVDSAYGGKTGVDLPEGKNYAGAFHQPSAVLCRPRRPRDAAARGSARRATWRCQDRADRRRPAVGARAQGGDPTPR